MKRLSILLLAVLPTLGVASGFRAFQLDPVTIEKFFPIAAKITGYDLPVIRPVVLVAEPSYFANHPACAGDGPDCIVYGEYQIDPSRPDVIFLNAATPATLRAPTLIHEIVHWLQEKAGRADTGCLGDAALEREAYLADHIYSVDYTPSKTPLEMPEFACK